MAKLKEHLEKLEYFLAVAQEGSFRRAAKRLNISQPSLTRAVRVLEDALDCSLFLRKQQPLGLTSQGETLMKYCERLFAGLLDLEQRISAPEAQLSGVIRVGTYDSIAVYFWPHFLKHYAEKFPYIKVELKTGRSASIQQDLSAGAVDFAVVIEPVPRVRFQIIELYRDRFSLYRSPTNTQPFRKSHIIVMADALSTNGEALESTLIKNNLSIEKKYVVSSLETAKEFARNGLGVAVLPTQVARTHILAGTLDPIRSEKAISFGEHRICAIVANEKLKFPIYQSLRDELVDFIKEWIKR